jgi:hypothetical protein
MTSVLLLGDVLPRRPTAPTAGAVNLDQPRGDVLRAGHVTPELGVDRVLVVPPSLAGHQSQHVLAPVLFRLIDGEPQSVRCQPLPSRVNSYPFADGFVESDVEAPDLLRSWLASGDLNLRLLDCTRAELVRYEFLHSLVHPVDN